MPSAEGKGTKANAKRLTFRVRDEHGLTPATEMPVRSQHRQHGQDTTAPDPEDGHHVTATVSTPSSEKPVFSLQLPFPFTLQFQGKAFLICQE